MRAVLSFIGLAVAIVLGSVWRGYVLSVLWGWFVIPVFEAPRLTTVGAIGLSLIASFLTYQSNAAKKRDDDALIEALAVAAVVPAMALTMGWVVHLFM